MKDLITQARAVEARLRTMTFSNDPRTFMDGAATINSLCTALEAAQKDAERMRDECDQITEMNHAQWLALENCKSIAARNRKEEWSQHILRFCADGGVVPNPLRFSIKAQGDAK